MGAETERYVTEETCSLRGRGVGVWGAKVGRGRESGEQRLRGMLQKRHAP